MSDFLYRVAVGGVAIDYDSRGLGTYTSASILNSDVSTANVGLLVYVGDVSGPGSLVCSIESSNDAGLTWAAVPGSATTALTAPGHATANVAIDSGADVRVTSTVSGSGSPTVTYRVMALAFTTS